MSRRSARPARPLAPRSDERAPSISRRSVLGLGALTLGLATSGRLFGQGLMLPVGDLAKLVRKLLAARKDGVRSSKRIRLVDPSTGRTATLLVADDGADTLALLITFAVTGEPLHVHTVTVDLAGEGATAGLYLELFRAPPEGRPDQEIVGARLEPAELDRLAAAISVTITVRGWDETFVATLDDNELEKIRRFHEARHKAADADEG